MIEIYFTKMHGNGNDFIVIDNRISITKNMNIEKFVKTICKRHFHIGADGVIFLEQVTNDVVTMRYFNSDGSEGGMCGNGARCFAKFVFDQGLTGKNLTLKTLSGTYGATIIDDQYVEIAFPSYKIEEINCLQHVLEDKSIYSVEVGVPHVVFFDQDIYQLEQFKYESLARKIRYNEKYFPRGTNVNMVERKNEHRLNVRTYERGVEEETFACGTGAIASTVVAASRNKVKSPVKVQMKGGDLIVRFIENNDTFTNVSLTGKAERVFEGRFRYED